MPWTTFFPADALSASFVALVIVWFIFWFVRLNKETNSLDSVRNTLAVFDKCVDPLRLQQQYRDRQKLQGLDMGAEPAKSFDNICAKVLGASVSVPIAIQNHFRAIFVAGCEESQLDTAELSGQTCKLLAANSDNYTYQLLLMFLTGVLGTLLALSQRFDQRALPPLIWGVIFAITGGLFLIRHRRIGLVPTLAQLRQKTIMLWIPNLYPTVAQRAAHWAIHTLKNAARVTDASDLIEKHALNFVGSIETARKAAEMFWTGMSQFTQGIKTSDQAIKDAQNSLAGEIQKFAESISRWSQFESEIRGFYGAVENHQHQIADEHRTFEAMLSGYYDLVRQSTSTLQQAAWDIGAASAALPETFRSAAETVTTSSAESQSKMADVVENLGETIRSGYREEWSQVMTQLQNLMRPVTSMEERLRALGTPFEAASKNLVEIAENIARLNDNFAREAKQLIIESRASQARQAKAGA
jgi:ABC-type transporter Mla subunit MlaD